MSLFNSLPQILFFGLVIFLVGFLILCFKKSDKNLTLIIGAIGFWLLATGFLSVNGFFLKYDVLPSRIMFAVFPMVLLLIYTSISSKALTLAAHIPQTWLIHVQTFRIVMEIILWMLAKQHIIPEIMTWDGHNFDIVVGITAPFVAYLCFTAKKWGKNVALIWNVIGMLFLINVFGQGLLSAPTPFQVF